MDFAGNPEGGRYNLPVTATRRGFIKTFAAIGASIAGGGALVMEPHWLEVTERTIPIPGLPSSLEGLTIAQISDLHIHGPAGVHQEVTRSLETRKPDILALTGDIIDDQIYLEDLKAFLESIRPVGAETFACLGNWEIFAGFPRMFLNRQYASLGVMLLVSQGAQSRAGLEVYATHNAYPSLKWRQRLVKLAGLKNGTRLLLTHSPVLLDDFPPGNGAWDLALAGHTHGGQVNLGPYMPWLPPASGRFVAGMYQTASGPAYVSRGVGNAIFDIRFNCRPELAYFTLARG